MYALHLIQFTKTGDRIVGVLVVKRYDGPTKLYVGYLSALYGARDYERQWGFTSILSGCCKRYANI